MLKIIVNKNRTKVSAKGSLSKIVADGTKAVLGLLDAMKNNETPKELALAAALFMERKIGEWMDKEFDAETVREYREKTAKNADAFEEGTKTGETEGAPA